MSTDPIKTTMEELNKILKSNSVIGEPIETEDKILIPVVKLGFGFAGGSKDETGGAGATGGIEPISMIIISKRGTGSDSIRVIDISKGDSTNKAISDLGLMVTDLIKSFISPDIPNPYSDAEWQYTESAESDTTDEETAPEESNDIKDSE